MAAPAPLSDESAAFMDIFNKVGGVDLTLPLDKIREITEEMNPMLKGDFVYEGTSEEKKIPSVDNGVEYTVPVTILRPKSESGVWTNVMLFFHGGGWVWGSRKSHMRICEMISQLCQCVVVNVEYRLAPENKFPACYVDAEAVVRWALDNKVELANNASAIVGVAGDSAGGNMSASICHVVKGLDYQVLIYPSFTMSSRAIYPSYVTYGEGHILSKEIMAWFTNHFLNNKEDAENVLCSPMERESFDGLPPALFVVSECDALADQSPDYQSKLEAAGVKTKLIVLKGTLHGFVTKPGFFKKTTGQMIDSMSSFLSKL